MAELTSRPWRRFRRLVHDLLALFLFGVILTSAALWLPPPAPRSLRPARENEDGGQPGSGITVSRQVLEIWLPEPLAGLAKQGPRRAGVRDHQNLRKILEGINAETAFYAMTVRGHQANGRAADVVFTRLPYREPDYFQEFLDVLAAAAGSPPRYPTIEYSAAAVHVLPANTSREELIRAIKATLVPEMVLDSALNRPAPSR